MSNKLSKQQDAQNLLHIFSKERYMVKEELGNILKLCKDADPYRATTEPSEFAFSRNKDKIEGIARNLYRKMEETDGIFNKDSNRGYSPCKTQQFESDFFSKAGGISPFESARLQKQVKDFNTRSHKFQFGDDSGFEGFGDAFKKTQYSAAQNRYNLGGRSDIDYSMDKNDYKCKFITLILLNSVK